MKVTVTLWKWMHHEHLSHFPIYVIYLKKKSVGTQTRLTWPKQNRTNTNMKTVSVQRCCFGKCRSGIDEATDSQDPSSDGACARGLRNAEVNFKINTILFDICMISTFNSNYTIIIVYYYSTWGQMIKIRQICLKVFYLHFEKIKNEILW